MVQMRLLDGGLIPDPDVLAQVTADPNCFSFVETIPGGFVPRFGGNNSDMSATGGFRGEVGGLGYDLSASWGESDTDFFIRNTLNASLGPDSPRDFVPGAYKQTEIGANADFNSLDYKIAGLYRVGDNLTLRSTYSTGFHAPSAGQATVTNVTTQNINGVLVDQGTIPLTTAPGQAAADFLEDQFGERPTLGTENAKNFSAGVAFDTGAVSWTFDYFNIKVEDRMV